MATPHGGQHSVAGCGGVVGGAPGDCGGGATFLRGVGRAGVSHQHATDHALRLALAVYRGSY